MLASRRSALPRRFKFGTPEEAFCPIRNGLVTPITTVMALRDELDFFSQGIGPDGSENYSEIELEAPAADRQLIVPKSAKKIELFVSTPGGLDGSVINGCGNIPGACPPGTNCLPVVDDSGESSCQGCKAGGRGVNLKSEFTLDEFCGNGTLTLKIIFSGLNDAPLGFPTNDTVVTNVQPKLLYTPDEGTEQIRWQSFTSGQGNAVSDECQCNISGSGSCSCVETPGSRGDAGQFRVTENLPAGNGDTDGIGTITQTTTLIIDSIAFTNGIENSTSVDVEDGVAFGTRIDPTFGGNPNCSGLDPVTVVIARFS